jgi:sugar lactone lactonase YvrE
MMRESSVQLLVALIGLGLLQSGCASVAPVVVPTGGANAIEPLAGIKGELYVSNRPFPQGDKCPLTWISVYGAGTPSLVRKLPGFCKGREKGPSLVFDSGGNAYWADYFNGAVLVFAPGKTKPSYRIAWGATSPYTLAVDGSGRLYVANVGPGVIGYEQSSISVYAHGKATPSYTITNGITYPTSLAVASSGELFVGNCPVCDSQYYGYSGTANVAIYAPGKKTPSSVLYRGVDNPDALALDSAGDLYVANQCASASCTHGDVAVYRPKATAPSLTITQGIGVPNSLLVDDAGTLYVNSNGEIAEFAKGQKTPAETIPVYDCHSAAITLDASHNLYDLLGDCNSKSHTPKGAVTVYSPGKTTPAYTITKGINANKSFAIAP